MTTLIKGGTTVSDGLSQRCDVLIDGEKIVAIEPAANGEGSSQAGETAFTDYTINTTVDATGCYVLPGIIDSHVHFRDPGLTAKGDFDSESRAAAAGGVTSVFDMPNTKPQTTTMEAFEEKRHTAAERCHVNYACFFGATADNTELFGQLDRSRVPGIKLFMGSSTGNMLVDDDATLERIFREAHRLGLPLVAHCEDTAMINAAMDELCQTLGTDDPPVEFHPVIRSREACYESLSKALSLAIETQARLHVAHVSTEEELTMFAPFTSTITAEACVGYLMFSLTDYRRLGSRIKVNPSIKDFRDQWALRQGLTDGHVATVATDHAPHLLPEKQGGCRKAVSGMPMVQFSLVTMLELVDEGVLTIERLVQLMAHNPARLFGLSERGHLQPGMKADIVVVKPDTPWTLTADQVESRCGWSPLEGHTFRWKVMKTLCNGHLVYDSVTPICGNSHVDTDYHGEELTFCHDDDYHLQS